jgi:uncharacterized protein (TIGR03435 family)
MATHTSKAKFSLAACRRRLVFITALWATLAGLVARGWAFAPISSAQASNRDSAQAASLSFDVASVRENKSGFSAPSDQPHSNFPIGSDDSYYQTGGEFSATNLPLDSYIIFAYKITNNNRDALIASLPGWALNDGFNIQARTDVKDVTKDQMRLMMQSLLADRFKLVVHHEKRDVPVFAAVLEQPGKLGPQLRKHSPEGPCPRPNPAQQPMSSAGAPPAPATDAAGFPAVCGGFANYLRPTAPYHRRFGGGNLSLSAIVGGLSGPGHLGRPVVDQTGLAGGYDFFIDYLPDPPPDKEPPADASGPNFVEALKTQLGIKLLRQRSTIDFVIVDHVERPSPN